MDLEQVLDEKFLMEKEIFDFISERFIKFKEKTGLYPTTVELDTVPIEELGQKPSTVFVDCKITVEI